MFRPPLAAMLIRLMMVDTVSNDVALKACNDHIIGAGIQVVYSYKKSNGKKQLCADFFCQALVVKRLINFWVDFTWL